MRFLQHRVFPICRYTKHEGKAYVKNLEGTGFFISNTGAYVTAGHVLDSGRLRASQADELLGICPHLVGTNLKVVIEIAAFDRAPAPYDIAVGKVDLPSDTTFVIQQREVLVWQDVATFGYPESVVNSTPSEFQIQARGHKGYIQRVVPSGRMPTGQHPDVFELSFPISKGLSGSPLFIYAGQKDQVVGVCVGSHQSRLVDYEEVVRSDQGADERQSFLRVEEFGIAHDLRGLVDWQPGCLGGSTLGEVG